MRPTLNPALRHVWRDAGTVQLGIDPDHAVVVTGLDAVTARLVLELDGRGDDEALRKRASDLGGRDGDVRALLALLRGSGVLADVSPDSRPQHPPDALRAELAALTLQHGLHHGTRVLGARRRREVHVVGAGRIGSAVVTLLGAAGVGRVVARDDGPALLDRSSRGVPDNDGPARTRRPSRASRPQPPDLVVLAPDAPLPDPVVVDNLVRRDIAHLLVTVRETAAVVGPLVVPGRSACLRCLHLHRVDRDPAWPQVAAQLCAPVPAPAPDVVLATLAAAGAVLQAVSWLDGATELPVLNGCLETTLPTGMARRRSWSPHPRCGCTWADEAQVASVDAVGSQ